MFLTSAIMIAGCQEDDSTIGNITTPANLEISYEIQGADAANPNGDGSGIVSFNASAENTISYKYVFPDRTTEVGTSGVTEKRFTTPGLNTYNVIVVASGAGGISTTGTVEIEVQSDFSDPETVDLLTGGDQKIWYWSASEVAHFGVGPNSSDPTQNYFWYFFAVEPFGLDYPAASCAYDDRFIFSLEGEQLRYTYENQGATFFNRSYASVAGGNSPDDNCYEFDTSGEKTVNLSPSESVVAANNIPGQTTGTVMNFSDGGFMGYYIGTSSYEILSITSNRMVVRAIQGNDPGLAWYQVFTTEEPGTSLEPEEDTFETLIWSDEFNTDGAPDPANWNYDLGTGQNGWGNNESQYYTDRPTNIEVADGLLKITAQRENFNGQAFTSARIKTKDQFEFTFGRVEVRAKLPQGGGTWPAIWMLGANIDTVGWPETGEIDIMEHVGNQQNTIFSSLHYPGNSGGNAVTESTTVADASTAFHVYAAEWTATQIRFYVDETLYHIFPNDPNLPFNKDFFLILNVAMGGNFGGTIDSSFNQSTMEVDYVRVYQ